MPILFLLLAYRAADFDGSSATKPGGWVEFQDWDGQIRSDDKTLEGTYLLQLQDTAKKAFEEMGINVNPGPEVKGWLENAGFTNITHKVLTC